MQRLTALRGPHAEKRCIGRATPALATLVELSPSEPPKIAGAERETYGERATRQWLTAERGPLLALCPEESAPQPPTPSSYPKVRPSQ